MYFVMSFKPLYAFKIIKGIKDCEIRTYFGYVSRGDTVLVYASSPTKAFIGEFTVEDTFIGYSDSAIAYLSNYCKLFDEDNWRFVYEHYIGSKRRLIVLRINDVTKYPRQVTLHEVKEVVPLFRPPLSYVSISEEFVRLIRSLAYL